MKNAAIEGKQKRPMFINAAIVILILAAAYFTFVLNAQTYRNFISDDALISLRYADNFLHGHGLAWNIGERPVEGYSNLLWILLISFIGLFQPDLIAAARIAGYFCVFLIMVSICLEFKRLRSKNFFLLAITLLFISFSGTVCAWAFGGLEQPLVCALLGLSFWAVFRHMEKGGQGFKNTMLPGALLALLALSRPDGIMFAFIITGMIVLFETGKGNERFKNIKLLAMPAGAYALQEIFRIAYYGALVPNTALVKISPSIAHLKTGLEYVSGGLVSMKILFIIAAAGALLAVFDGESRKKAAILLAALASWLAYVTFIGGDIFPGYRHMMPAVTIAVFLMIEGFMKLPDTQAAAIKAQANVAAKTLIISFGAAACVFFGITQQWEVQNFKAQTETWESRAMEAGRVLGKVFKKEQPLVAVTAAGSLPYASHLPALDMFGLNDYDLPRFYKSKNAGNGWIGHEAGSAEYVIRRMPDLISLYDSSAETVHYAWWNELIAMPEFRDNYRLIYFYCPENKFTARLWADIHSKKTGIRQENGAIIIPAYFFSTEMNPENDGGLTIKAGSRAIIRDIDIENGKYAIKVIGADGLSARFAPAHGVQKNRTNIEVINSGAGDLALERIDLEKKQAGSK